MYVDHGTYIERADGACIPIEAGNRDYAAYRDWVAAGNTPSQPQSPSHDELVDQARADSRTQRQPIISVLDGLQASALALSDTANAQSIEVAKQGLRDITLVDLSACQTYEDMRLAVKERYLQIAGAVSDDVRKAFSDALK